MSKTAKTSTSGRKTESEREGEGANGRNKQINKQSSEWNLYTLNEHLITFFDVHALFLVFSFRKQFCWSFCCRRHRSFFFFLSWKTRKKNLHRALLRFSRYGIFDDLLLLVPCIFYFIFQISLIFVYQNEYFMRIQFIQRNNHSTIKNDIVQAAITRMDRQEGRDKDEIVTLP